MPKDSVVFSRWCLGFPLLPLLRLFFMFMVYASIGECLRDDAMGVVPRTGKPALRDGHGFPHLFSGGGDHGKGTHAYSLRS